MKTGEDIQAKFLFLILILSPKALTIHTKYHIKDRNNASNGKLFHYTKFMSYVKIVAIIRR